MATMGLRDRRRRRGIRDRFFEPCHGASERARRSAAVASFSALMLTRARPYDDMSIFRFSFKMLRRCDSLPFRAHSLATSSRGQLAADAAYLDIYPVLASDDAPGLCSPSLIITVDSSSHFFADGLFDEILKLHGAAHSIVADKDKTLEAMRRVTISRLSRAAHT